MKLLLTRDQASGILGGVKFKLRAQVRLTKREAALVRKYRADREVLLQREITVPFTTKSILLGIGIGGLIAGQEFKCKDIADILEYERNVKEACDTFKKYLDVMSSFGGQEVVEYSDSGSGDEESDVEESEPSPPLDDGIAADDDDDELPAVDDQGGRTEPAAENEALEEGSDFCYHCGAVFPEGSTTCPACHKRL